MRILITGTLSGLGKHTHETLGGICWNRQLTGEDREEIKRNGVDCIIHCAFNSHQSVGSCSLYAYMSDNVLLTKELVSVPHQKFILISSVDVYPQMPGLRYENHVIDINAINGIYGITKLMSEAIVREHCPDYLILRCASLLGRDSRKNSLIRIIEDDPCTLTLSDDSRLNYVLHSDVSDFIQFAMKYDVRGIYNVASADNMVLSAVANILGKQVNFGSYRYDVGDIDNSKISSISPTFKKSSMKVITQFLLELSEKDKYDIE